MIERGGCWKLASGATVGLGNYEHYRRLMTLLWPKDDEHRWFLLMLKEFLQNTLTTVMGPKDSSKTRSMAKIALADYYCFPQTTMALISSTDIRGLELRVWGDIKTLHTIACENYEDTPGHLIDSKHAICTDNLDEDKVRDMRKGLICIPCLTSSGQYVGLGKYVGIKQERRRLYSDEASLMRASFLDSLANLNSGNFKGMFIGNPIGDGDPLDKLGEPIDGWASLPEPEKTTVWNTRDMGGRCINLVGKDSPNFDVPEDAPVPFPYLITRNSMARVAARFGENSFQYYSQCLGIRMTGMDAKKVITHDLCYQFHAMEEVFWMDERQIKIYAIDAAYGNIGGDRCVGGWISYGKDITNKSILRINRPKVIPVRPASVAGKLPEDQIAAFVRAECELEKIDPSHVFYDATGRGSLGTSFARIWSSSVNPVEFGGSPTDRPVPGEMIRDKKTGQERAKKASEHFDRFVTELWFNVRYAIESGQARGLPEEVMDEGCRRMWTMTKGDKVSIETKADMKERTGESPDLFDWLVTANEGALRTGFVIAKIGNEFAPQSSSIRALERLQRERRESLAGSQLTY